MHLQLNGTAQEALPRVAPYSIGSCFMSVCAAGDALKEEIEEAANNRAPTGLSHGWEIHSKKFVSGEPNPCPCTHHPERKHWLLSC